MSKITRNILIPAALLALVYNLLPLFMHDTGGAMMILLILLPAATLIASGYVGLRAGFRWYWPLIAAVLFLPAVFLYMNASAWIYIPGFGIVALVGEWIGNLIRS